MKNHWKLPNFGHKCLLISKKKKQFSKNDSFEIVYIFGIENNIESYFDNTIYNIESMKSNGMN